MRPQLAKSGRNFRLGSRWHCCLVWLLCVCSWRAPVPVLHFHGSDAQALAESALFGPAISDSTAQLLKHLELFHAHATELAEAHWHLHFVVPSPVPAVPGCPDHETMPAQPLSAPSSTSSTMVDLAVDDFLQTPSSASDAAVPAAAILGNQSPRLIPLAPPRVRPKRLSPVIAFCVSRC